jgi:autoinducer 2-degrading protein
MKEADMVILMVQVHIKPEMRDRFLAVIEHDATHSEGDEPGCLRFDVLQDSEDPNQFYYYEVYRDEAARAAHRETPHFKSYSEQIGEFSDGETVRHILRNVHPADGAWR